jgi:hypothetical protein
VSASAVRTARSRSRCLLMCAVMVEPRQRAVAARNPGMGGVQDADTQATQSLGIAADTVKAHVALATGRLGVANGRTLHMLCRRWADWRSSVT